MGLAASQARYLGLTARKSNIEYEGQQVNQQRMALAEEVNSLYNKLLSLDVPIAPDTTDFYESNYSFSIADKTNGKDGEYVIKNYYENNDGSYYIDVERTYNKNMAEQSDLSSGWTVVVDSTTTPATYSIVSNAEPSKSYPLTALNATDSESMIELINGTEGLTELPVGSELHSYRDSDGKTHYIPSSQVLSYAGAESPLDSYMKINKSVTETTSFEEVNITLDGNGRMASISIDGLVTDLDIDTTRTYDTEGYDAALRDYTMSKDEYDKIIADLNAQTESLQQEDKVLELRLNQIDTEQKELNTELEAVKEVLKTNVENTFKTFA